MKTIDSPIPMTAVPRTVLGKAPVWQKLVLWTALCLAVALRSPAQGMFQNLDFESPNVGGLTNMFVAFSDAFPGWMGWFRDTNMSSVAGYNFVSAGSALATLITPAASSGNGALVIEGNYTATIAAGLAGPNGVLSSAAISQTGTIPGSTKSLRFSASGNADYLAITFNGTNVSFFSVGSGSNFTAYAGDLAAFAGQTGELRFTEQAAVFEPVVILDDIQFSTSVVPEPSALVLTAMGVLVFGYRHHIRATGQTSRKRPSSGR